MAHFCPTMERQPYNYKQNRANHLHPGKLLSSFNTDVRRLATNFNESKPGSNVLIKR